MSAKRYVAMHQTAKGYKTMKAAREYISSTEFPREWRVVELGEVVTARRSIVFDNLIDSALKSL